MHFTLEELYRNLFPGGSSFGGVFQISRAEDNSNYAFDFDNGQETFRHKMVNFLRYREFLRRMEGVLWEKVFDY